MNSAERRRYLENLVGELRFADHKTAFVSGWQRERVDAVVREDLRDLSRIVELDRVQMLAALLPERASSLLSVQSLREDLEVGHETVRRWLTALGAGSTLALPKPRRPE